MNITLPNNINLVLPENKYERVAKLQELSIDLEYAKTQCDKILEEELSQLVGTQDDTYRVVPTFESRKSTEILEDKFKEECPKLYDQCLSITGANAMKLIGEDKMIELCRKYAGEERTSKSSSLTLKRMSKVLTDDEMNKYTKVYYKQKGYAVEKYA